MKRRKRLAVTGINVLAWALSLVMLAPLLLILFNSLKTGKAAADMRLSLPASPEWSNYALVIEKGKLGTTFLNSMLYSVSSVVHCILTGYHVYANIFHFQCRTEISKLAEVINTHIRSYPLILVNSIQIAVKLHFTFVLNYAEYFLHSCCHETTLVLNSSDIALKPLVTETNEPL